jgi:hypothetical protein
MFIKDYSYKAALLIILLKKGRDFYIGKKEIITFKDLKNKF